jgi:oxygen-independent coproporphyrinogen-3 oxidase
VAAEAFAENWYAEAVRTLVDAGYERYEVSNFALPGHECRHNQAYWLGEDYVGLGASAVSTVAGIRRTNPSTVAGYLAGEAPGLEEIDDRTRMFEKAMLGLRTSQGVEEAEVLGALDMRALDRLCEQGCVERRYGRIRLNPGFMDVSNSIIAALLEPPEAP